MQVEITKNKIIVEIPKEGGDNEENMTKTKVEKQEVVEEKETKTEGAEKTEAKAEEKTESKEEKTEEAVAETKEEATEAKTEATEEGAKSEESEKKSEEAEKAEKSEATSQEVIVKVDFEDFKKDFDKFVSPLKEEIATLSKAIATLATSKAPTEGAADAEVTHTEKADKVEETDDASKEEGKKSDTSSEGASNSEGNAEVLKAIADLKQSYEERLTKLEAQPATSKVVVVQKGDGLTDAEAEGELTKITARLGEIAKVRDTDPVNYHRDTKLQDEAFELIRKRKELTK